MFEFRCGLWNPKGSSFILQGPNKDPVPWEMGYWLTGSLWWTRVRMLKRWSILANSVGQSDCDLISWRVEMYYWEEALRIYKY